MSFLREVISKDDQRILFFGLCVNNGFALRCVVKHHLIAAPTRFFFNFWCQCLMIGVIFSFILTQN